MTRNISIQRVPPPHAVHHVINSPISDNPGVSVKDTSRSEIENNSTTKLCRDCKALVRFFDNIRGPSGARTPHDLDGGRHECSVNLTDEEVIVSSAINYVQSINRFLTTTQLGLLREEARKENGNY